MPKSRSPALEVNHREAVERSVGNEAIDVDFKFPQVQVETSILRQAAVLVNKSTIAARLDRRPKSRVVQNRKLVASSTELYCISCGKQLAGKLT